MRDSRTAKVKPDTDFGKLPLYFIPNQGQVDRRAKFYARASRYTLWFTSQGLVFDGIRREPADKKHAGTAKAPDPGSAERDLSRLVFVGANPSPEIVPLAATEHHVNYFIGNDPKQWRSGIHTFQTVLYKEVYPNIDLKVYGVEKQVEYDWVVRPGGDPAQITFRFENVKGTHVEGGGDLVIETRFGAMIHKKPVGYQKNGAGQRPAPGSDRVHLAFAKKSGKNSWGFAVGDHDRSRELIIDPVVLLYSTYLGGGGDEYGYGIAVDGSGCAYVTGVTSSNNFPTQNPMQSDQGGLDAFVTKLNAAGTGLVYSTYLGGGDSEFGFGIAVDGSGCAYVTGSTISNNFPTRNPLQTFQGGVDAFVTKLNAAGNSLVYSTYLGGGNFDKGNGIAVDGSGCAYVTGQTNSNNFPTQNPLQTYRGGTDAFVTKLNTAGTGLAYSTYLGGGGYDLGNGIAVDGSGCAYVTGQTNSNNFPTQNPFQTDQGNDDAFVTKLNAAGTGLVYSTYLGGGAIDQGYGIAVDGSGCAYVTGLTWSNDFPTQNPMQTLQGSSDAFVTKLNAAGTGLVYSTYTGGGNYDQGYGIAVDGSGCAYVTGLTYSTNFPTQNPFQIFPGTGDAFVTKLNAAGTGLVYSTYLGGGALDQGNGIAVDGSGCAYVTGQTFSHDFPTQNPFQTFQGNADAFVTKLAMVHTVSFMAGANGHLAGNSSQTVVDGQSSTPVTAIADSGYHFVNWTGSGGFQSTANPLTVTNVSGDMQISAHFDNAPPTVKITSPANNASVSGTVAVTAEANDDSAVDRVEFYIDGILRSTGSRGAAAVFAKARSRAAYTYSWDTRTASEGAHKIRAVAYDAAGLSAADEITVNVNNIRITLSATRVSDKAWIIQRDFGKIAFSVENPAATPVTYFILRKSGGQAFQALKQVAPGDLQGGAYAYLDKWLEKGKTYTYKVEARAADGSVISASAEIAI